MAHTCSDCGDTCYCNGDIDDYVIDGGIEEQRCDHFLQCNPDGDDD